MSVLLKTSDGGVDNIESKRHSHGFGCHFYFPSEPGLVDRRVNYDFVTQQCCRRCFVLDCPYVASSVCLFVRSSDQILLPQYLMNDLNNFDETDGE